jgi:hypothetical protein
VRKSLLGPGEPLRFVRLESLESLGTICISSDGTSDVGFTEQPKIYLRKHHNLGHHPGVKKLGRLSRCERDEQDSPRK